MYKVTLKQQCNLTALQEITEIPPVSTGSI